MRGAPALTVAVINRADMVATQGLGIEVCYPAEIDLSELDVNVYVTERKEWAIRKGVLPYSHYFNPQFISVPGTLGQPVSEALWKPSGDFCHSAYLEDAFVDTHDWVQQGLCPFKAISVVATYRMGAWNAGTSIECQVPN